MEKNIILTESENMQQNFEKKQTTEIYMFLKHAS